MNGMKTTAKSIFSEGEDKDFAYIQKFMDRWEIVIFSMTQPAGEGKREVIQEAQYSVNVLAMVLSLVRAGSHSLEKFDLGPKLIKSLQSEIPELSQLPKEIRIEAPQKPEVSDELFMFGLIQRGSFLTSVPHTTFVGSMNPGTHPVQTTYVQQTAYQLEFTNKIHRFRYWLAVNKLMPDAKGLQPTKPFERMLP
jgi:hypothetical protein